jgi:membrane-associated HD superfamily phosphohydrolase
VTIIAYVVLKIDKAKNEDESKDYKAREKKMRKRIAVCLLYFVSLILIYFMALAGGIDFIIFIYTLLILALILIVLKKYKLYFCGMLLAIMGLLYLAKSDEITSITFFIPIVLFVISIILRLIKNKKVSNIIWIISMALVCIIGARVGISNYNYNKQFMQYMEKEYNY